jgi:hypothetical protein
MNNTTGTVVFFICLTQILISNKFEKEIAFESSSLDLELDPDQD